MHDFEHQLLLMDARTVLLDIRRAAHFTTLKWEGRIWQPVWPAATLRDGFTLTAYLF